ncbi:uncharacterized protein BT62DRAFT_1077154 [Guyanagaster necrorhizus]|uniref:Uncharacterized protein n=1 Tax=Guyanagaster necrorhizus TaxID=856835 RepID=A0A9P7VS16_9AGAR|nr:uncharacterized protein BT62DRAFT_1077154 [Guyanagaster necrorhizus MCA 3950]KAG7444926.1 hypothetical protein BT62DRAFT_1077154 [Guyanagaster necrorhizus MCA 3950]
MSTGTAHIDYTLPRLSRKTRAEIRQSYRTLETPVASLVLQYGVTAKTIVRCLNNHYQDDLTWDQGYINGMRNDFFGYDNGKKCPAEISPPKTPVRPRNNEHEVGKASNRRKKAILISHKRGGPPSASLGSGPTVTRRLTRSSDNKNDEPDVITISDDEVKPNLTMKVEGFDSAVDGFLRSLNSPHMKPIFEKCGISTRNHLLSVSKHIRESHKREDLKKTFQDQGMTIGDWFNVVDALLEYSDNPLV